MIARAYAALLVLLPRAVREEDGREIADAFAQQWSEARGVRRRLRVLARGFGGLAVAIVMERADRWRGARAARTAGPSGSAVGVALAGREWRRRRMSGAWNQVRHGTRSLVRTPSFTTSVVLLFALGVGSVTTIWTLVDHVLLRSLPYPHAERLFEVQNGSHPGPMFEEFQRFRSADAWAAATTADANLTGTATPQRVREVRVSRDFFTLFGARPALGRLFVADDFRSATSVILSYGTWQRLFGGEDVVGRTIMVDGAALEVIGVLAASFVAPEQLVEASPDVWRPIDTNAEWYGRHDFHMLSVAGRLREGLPFSAIVGEAEALAERRAAELPEQYVNREGETESLPVETLREATVGEVRQGLTLFLGAVTLLLLVACTNVAHLFMARGLSRVREMAVRRAIGARMATLTGQLAVESLLVGAAGGLLGVLLAFVGVRAFVLLSPEALPRTAGDLAVDVRVLGFALAVSAATAVLFGLLPALGLIGRDVTTAMQSRVRGGTEGRFAPRMRAALVVAEVALSLVIVTQAGSLLRSFVNLYRQDAGFRTSDVWTVPLTITGIETTAEWNQRLEGIRASLASVPGVRQATLGLTMPYEFTGGGRCCWRTRIGQADSERETPAMMHPVSESYFRVFDLRFVAGRAWAPGDDRARPVPAVMMEPLAVEMFGSANAAIGREIAAGTGLSVRVTGVIAPYRHYGPDLEPDPSVLFPITATPFVLPRAHFAVLAERADAGFAGRLREAIWRVEPDLPVPIIRSIEDWAGAATARARFESVLFSVFGTVALLLVAGGLCGTLLYAVGRRRRELGIRLALGDAPGRLERRVLSQGLRATAAGGVLGGIGAWSAGRLIENRLFGVEAGDPSTLAGALFVLFGVALLASWLPARRAAGTDPMEALRTE